VYAYFSLWVYLFTILYWQSRLLAAASLVGTHVVTCTYKYTYYMYVQVLLTRAQDLPQCVPPGCWTTPSHSRELPHYQSPHALSEKMKGGRVTGIWLLPHALKPFSILWNSFKSGIVAIQAGFCTCRCGYTQVAYSASTYPAGRGAHLSLYKVHLMVDPVHSNRTQGDTNWACEEWGEP